MEAILRAVFVYQDGKEYTMTVQIPQECADMIGIKGLAAVRVYVGAKLSNINAGVKKPEFLDFKKTN